MPLATCAARVQHPGCAVTVPGRDGAAGAAVRGRCAASVVRGVDLQNPSGNPSPKNVTSRIVQPIRKVIE